MMKKYGLNLVARSRMKHRNRQDYQDHKFAFNLTATEHLLANIGGKEKLCLKHSGNSGDIIYTLPAMYAIAQGKPFDLALSLAGEAKYHKAHPLGNKMLNEKMVAMLKPLLEAQAEINECFAHSNQAVDVDLDIFRKLPILFESGLVKGSAKPCI
jgi:hypothetical protein